MLSTEILYDAFEDNLLLICMILSSCVTSFGFFQLYANTKEQYELLALICQAAKFPHLLESTSKFSNEQLCQALITKNQISPNSVFFSKHKLGTTAFLSACYGGSLTLIGFMLDLGADVGVNVNGGPLWNAVVGIVERVKQVTDEKNLARRSFEIRNAILMIDYLLFLGCDVNAANDRGWTPIHWSSVHGMKWLTEHLIKRGANLRIQTHLGVSAMDCTNAFDRSQASIAVLKKDKLEAVKPTRQG